MTEIKYVNSSESTVNLLGNNMRITDGNFHNYEWVIEQKDNRTKISSIKKKPITYSITVTLRGSIESRKKRLDEIRDIFEEDIYLNSPGKLYFGDYYIECFAYSSNTHVNDNRNNRTDVDMIFYCPYPFWIKEINYVLSNLLVNEEGTDMDYPHDFPFDFANSRSASHLMNEGIAPAHFKMIIYGPCSNPEITISNQIYNIECTVASDEYLVIDSMKKKVYLVEKDGAEINQYANRDREHYIYEKIPVGANVIEWSGNYRVEITLIQERSEPKWI
jgi:hypothetical protein